LSAAVPYCRIVDISHETAYGNCLALIVLDWITPAVLRAFALWKILRPLRKLKIHKVFQLPRSLKAVLI